MLISALNCSVSGTEGQTDTLCPRNMGQGRQRDAAVAGYEAAPGGWGRSVVTIGVFDGVHRGHQAIIGHAVKRARELGLAVGRGDLRPAPGRGGPARLAPGRAHRAGPQGRADRAARRRRALRACRSRSEFSRLSRRGVRARRAGRAPARRVGRGRARTSASGTRPPATWRCWSGSAAPSASRWRARRWSPTTGTVFSSTYIRACVDAGDVAAAAAALGRPHRLEGIVVRGDQRGRELGFPTANLLPRTATRRCRPTGSTRPGWSAAAARRAAAGGRLGRHQPDLLRPGAPGRGVRPRLRRRPLRRAARARLRRPAARAAPLRRRSSRWSRRSREDVDADPRGARR